MNDLTQKSIDFKIKRAIIRMIPNEAGLKQIEINTTGSITLTKDLLMYEGVDGMFHTISTSIIKEINHIQ